MSLALEKQRGELTVAVYFLSFMRDQREQIESRLRAAAIHFQAQLEIVFHSSEWKRISKQAGFVGLCYHCC
jgi:hypothetical protein